ncbi:MAG: hypothetical protein V3U24_02580 [Candidatus Neomarinimicrobiota bacterium]
MSSARYLRPGYGLAIVSVMILFSCGPKKPVSPSATVAAALQSSAQPVEKMDFFPAVERARNDIASLIGLSKTRLDATFTAVIDSAIAQGEAAELDGLRQKENSVFQDLIATLDMFLQYVPSGGVMDQEVTRGRNNVAAKYESYTKSIDAGVTDEYVDAVERTAIESNARSLMTELQFVESSLPLPLDSLKAGPTFVLEADSVDLFFEVQRDIEDMSKELEQLRATVEQYQTAKAEMNAFLERERVLSEQIQKSQTDIQVLEQKMDTTRQEQKQGFSRLDTKLKEGADSLGTVIRQVEAGVRTDLSKLSSGIQDSLTAQKQGSDSLFFQVGTNIKLFREEIDSLKGIIRYFDIAEKGLPEIDEEILNILKLPTLRHKVTLKNGTVFVGELLAENLDVIIMQTAIGKLVVEKDSIVEFEEKYFPGPRVEFEGEYEQTEYRDREEFQGMVRNVGKKKADFVKVTFFLWDARSNPVGVGSAFVEGSTTEFDTGVISEATVVPGELAMYRVVVEKEPGKKVAYRTNEVKWRDYK